MGISVAIKRLFHLRHCLWMDIVYSFQIALKILVMVYWVQCGQTENSEGVCEYLTQNSLLSSRQWEEISIPSSWNSKNSFISTFHTNYDLSCVIFKEELLAHSIYAERCSNTKLTLVSWAKLSSVQQHEIKQEGLFIMHSLWYPSSVLSSWQMMRITYQPH